MNIKQLSVGEVRKIANTGDIQSMADFNKKVSNMQPSEIDKEKLKRLAGSKVFSLQVFVLADEGETLYRGQQHQIAIGELKSVTINQ